MAQREMFFSGNTTASGSVARESSTRVRTDSKKINKSPTERPPFTLSQIKKSIPPHCFNRSLLRSLSYVIEDLLICSILFYLALTWIHTIPVAFRYVTWVVYWAAQGSMLAGIWILGHECGHHALSNYSLLDDLVGLTLHSALLVPYFSFKYSHRRHHSNTGSLEHDEVYVPKKKCHIPWYYKYIYNNPVGQLLSLTIQLMLGWALYLAFNVSGHQYSRFACHYDPYSPIYTKREQAHIFISDACVIASVFVLYCLASSFGFWWLVRVYGVPLLVENGWIVCLSYLQHTHPALPHYDSTEWDWLRGALSTVDRDYRFFNKLFHNSTDAHVVHHLFPTIPHYHAVEATKAIKPILGGYYRFDGTPVIRAIWREAKECVYVEQENCIAGNKTRGIFWYNNKF